MDYQDQDKKNKQHDVGSAAAEIGERILSVIQDSVESMDFQDLSYNIQNVLETAKDEVLKQADHAKNYMGNQKNGRNAAQADRQGKSGAGNRWEDRAGTHRFNNGGHGRMLVPGKLKRNPGLYSGPAEIGFGSAGIALVCGLGIGFGATAAVGGAAAVAGAVFGVPALLFAGLLGKGIWDSKRARRIRRYAGEWMGKSYIMIEDLEGKCHVGRKRIVKDIRYLTQRKLLPGAVMDREETCLILTDEARGQYEAAVSQREERERKIKEEQQFAEQMNNAPEQEREIYRIKKDGQQYLKQMDSLKKEIRSEDVREKLDRMEVLAARIFVCASKHPESISQTDRLFRYYFPSVIKLMQVYKDMEEQPIQGENIRKTKTEIEASLDTMNQALEKLFDEMFQNVAMDVSSDIKVLEMMLKQDGLTGDGMKADPSQTIF